MEKITLKPLLHKSKECIAVYFKNNASLNNIIKKQEEVRWSQTHKCWCLPLSQEAFEALKLSVKELATLEYTALKIYLQKKNLLLNKPVAFENSKPAETMVTKTAALKQAQLTVLNNVSTSNLQQLTLFIEMLKLKAYSASTIKTYRNEFLQLLQLLKNKPVENLSVEDLKRYMVYAMEKQGINENTAHSRLNALKFYYEQVLGREKFFWEIPRPKKQDQLPKLFNQDEIAAIINSVQNKKHKVMLMLAYSGGLRVSEVISIKTFDIDSNRMTIFIRQAKGKKDRIVTLSPVLLVLLREYALEYKPNKKGYLFEGSTKDSPYSARSLQEVIQAAKKKAGIMKPGSIHSLRHSFATHLIEKGTDVTMIQKLLGHNDIKTTMRYLHTSNKDLIKIISPLDDLKLT